MLRWLVSIIATILRLVIPCKIYGKENIVKHNTVYMCNHQSINDMIILLAHLPSNTHFIAKKEIFKNKLFSWVLKEVRVFPVDRGSADLKAIKHACNVLKDGNNLMIFPQGTRMDSPEVKLEDMHAGTGMFALKNQSVVVPMMFKEKPKFFKKNTLYIGEPLDLSAFEGKKANSQVLSDFTALACEKMNELLGENK